MTGHVDYFYPQLPDLSNGDPMTAAILASVNVMNRMPKYAGALELPDGKATLQWNSSNKGYSPKTPCQEL